LEAEKITSSLQQEQRQVQQQERQRQQQERQQVQQQGLQQQELVLLFCHKRLKQRPTKLPRGVIFSWGFPLIDTKNVSRDATYRKKSDM
jgi:hypothetical protein